MAGLSRYRFEILSGHSGDLTNRNHVSALLALEEMKRVVTKLGSRVRGRRHFLVARQFTISSEILAAAGARISVISIGASHGSPAFLSA